MILKTGNMFESVSPNMALIATGNNCIKKDGSLVMGAGSALELAQFEPMLPIIFGHMLSHNVYTNYNVMITCQYNFKLRMPLHYGLLQTKENWKEPSKLETVLTNISIFNQYTWVYKNLTYRLAFPGIKNGGLISHKDTILNELRKLPDCVEVWEKS